MTMTLMLFVILLAILMGISAIEYVLLANGKSKLSDEQVLDYRIATTWAFWGVIGTVLLAAGNEIVLALPGVQKLGLQSTQHTLLVVDYVLPLIFICNWAANYMSGSVALNLAGVQAQHDEELMNEIILYLQERHSNPANPVDSLAIYQRIQNVPTRHIFGGRTLWILRIVSVRHKAINQIFQQMKGLAMTEENIDQLLEHLAAQRRGQIQGSKAVGYYYDPSNPPQPPPPRRQRLNL